MTYTEEKSSLATLIGVGLIGYGLYHWYSTALDRRVAIAGAAGLFFLVAGQQRLRQIESAPPPEPTPDPSPLPPPAEEEPSEEGSPEWTQLRVTSEVIAADLDFEKAFGDRADAILQSVGLSRKDLEVVFFRLLESKSDKREVVGRLQHLPDVKRVNILKSCDADLIEEFGYTPLMVEWFGDDATRWPTK